VAVVFTIEASYSFPEGTDITAQQATIAIARSNGVDDSAVSVTITGLAETSDGARRLRGVQVDAEIKTADSDTAQAAAANSADADELSSQLSKITGTTVQPPEVVAQPKLAVNVETRVRSSSFMLFEPESQADDFAQLFSQKIGKPVVVKIEYVTSAPTTAPTHETLNTSNAKGANEVDTSTPLPTSAEAGEPSTAEAQSSEGRVVFSLRIENINYALLLTNIALLRNVEETLQDTIARESVEGTLPEHIDIELSAGSLVARVVVTPPENTAATSVQETIALSTRLISNVALNLNSIDGLSNVTTGQVVVNSISAVVVASSVQDAPSTTETSADDSRSSTRAPSITTKRSTISIDLEDTEEGDSQQLLITVSIASGVGVLCFVCFCYYCCRDCLEWPDIADPCLVRPDEAFPQRFGQFGARPGAAYHGEMHSPTPTPREVNLPRGNAHESGLRKAASQSAVFHKPPREAWAWQPAVFHESARERPRTSRESNLLHGSRDAGLRAAASEPEGIREPVVKITIYDRPQHPPPRMGWAWE